jgi:tetratricopeptide (TPR) repeat protein
MRFRNLVINLGAIAIFGAIALSLQLPRLNQKLIGQNLEETQKSVREEESRLRVIRQLPSRGLGFNNMIANFTFLQFLQYFGDDVARNKFQTGYGLTPMYFYNVIDRDPRFLSSYLYVSSGVSIFSGQPKQAIEIYTKGLKSLNPDQEPAAYMVWRYKATDQLLFMGDAKGARESYLQASDWAEKASLSGQKLVDDPKLAAELSRQSAQWLEQERDLTKAQIAAWSLVLGNATDKKTVEIVAQELDKLGMKIEIKDDRPVVVPK